MTTESLSEAVPSVDLLLHTCFSSHNFLSAFKGMEDPGLFSAGVGAFVISFRDL